MTRKWLGGYSPIRKTLVPRQKVKSTFLDVFLYSQYPFNCILSPCRKTLGATPEELLSFVGCVDEIKGIFSTLLAVSWQSMQSIINESH